MDVGYSPCPNDCFIFYALAHGKVAPELKLNVRLEDVETLNQLAQDALLPVSKISVHAYLHLTETYVMLPAGGALGYGVGPLLVTRQPLKDLRGKTVAIPGARTTAALLLQLSQRGQVNTRTMRYDTIMPAVAAGEVDAGLIIHESRFTFQDHGLRCHLDVGQWWEEQTGLPLPLGGVMVKRSLGQDLQQKLNTAIVQSLEFAYANQEEAQPYIASHAQELSPAVMQKHIDLYVNAASFDVGDLGRRAVSELYARARSHQLVPEINLPLFANA